MSNSSQQLGTHPTYPSRLKKNQPAASLVTEAVWGWGLDEGHAAAEWTQAMDEVEMEALAEAEAEAVERELARRKEEEEVAEAAEAGSLGDAVDSSVV